MNVYLTQIHGGGATVAVGAGAQSVTVNVGDLEAVLAYATSFLGASEVEDLRRAVADDGDEPGENTRTFLQRVRTNGAALAIGVTSSAAYEGLLALLRQAFPGFMS